MCKSAVITIDANAHNSCAFKEYSKIKSSTQNRCSIEFIPYNRLTERDALGQFVSITPGLSASIRDHLFRLHPDTSLGHK